LKLLFQAPNQTQIIKGRTRSTTFTKRENPYQHKDNLEQLRDQNTFDVLSDSQDIS